MIKIRNEEGKIEIVFSHGYPIGDYTTTLEVRVNDDCFRELLYDSMWKQLKKTLISIKTMSYNEGYRDGRNHRQKIKYFSPEF